MMSQTEVLLQKQRFVLSSYQEVLWFMHRLDPDNPVYHHGKALELQGALDVRLLEQSLNEVIARHEALRTTFVSLEDKPYQQIAPELQLSVQVLAAVETREAAQRLLEAEVRRPFDLEQGPLVRLTLLPLGAERHVLLATVHRIIADEQALQLLLQELAEVYAAFAEQRAVDLPAVALQYREFAAEQQQLLAGAEYERLAAYWKEALSGATTFLELPTDHSRPPLQRFQGAEQRFTLPEPLTAGLQALADQAGVALELLVLAVYEVMLHRLMRQNDLLLGLQVSGREFAAAGIGLFANTLVLRADLSGNLSFRAVIDRVRGAMEEVWAHRAMPFEKLVDLLQVKRDLSYNPLVQTSYRFLNRQDALPDFGGLQASEFVLANETARFDLSLLVEHGAGEIVCRLEYNTDLFAAATVERMAGHLQQLLTAAVDDPLQPIATMPLLMAEEKELLRRWNDTAVAYPETCLHLMFEAQVERTPDRVAAIYEGQALTYRELNERANQLAHYLRGQGVGPETLVGLFVERSLELAIGIFGILKAGGAYLPLDPSYPRDRIDFMLEDSRVHLLLTQEKLAPVMAGNAAQIVCLDRDWYLMEAQSTENVQSGVQPTNLAYVIYTSGSTGKPKGVMIEHLGICNRFCWLQEKYRLTERDRVLHKTLFSFDWSVFEFFWCFTAGAALVIATPDGHQDNAYIVDLIKREQVTTMFYVPSLLQLLLEEPGIETCTSVRQVFCSGEALSHEAQQRYFAKFPHGELLNMYGPTEASVEVTHWTCERNSERKYVPIGHLIANTQVHVLDEAMQPMPIGAVGELFIGGIGLARGYLNRPELTAERFIPNPFSSAPGARLYRTGDLGRYLADGCLQYISRIDHQVKVRGVRIELGEIEYALLQHPQVAEAVVMVREDVPGRKRIVAYAVPQDGAELLWPEVRSFLKERLPEYMIPVALMTIEAIPLSPNGKMDRRLLPVPQVQGDGGNEPVAPRNEHEQLLADVWAEVLAIPQVGVYDNFFEVGGDSILSIQILTRVRRRGVQIEARDLFHYQTIAELASAIQARQSQATELTAEQVRAALAYWLDDTRQATPLPLATADTELLSPTTVTVQLGAAESKQLLTEVHKAYHTKPSDLWITALLQACADVMNAPALWLAAGGDLLAELTAVQGKGANDSCLVYVSLPEAHDVGEQLKQVKEQLRQVPSQHTRYQTLQERAAALCLTDVLQALPQPQVAVDAAEQASGLTVTSTVVEGQFLLTLASRLLAADVLARLQTRLLAALRKLIAHCQQPQAGGFTPSDFAAAKLNQQQLDKFLANLSKSKVGKNK